MGLKAGDKVRFLDETGSGTITRFLDNKQALVLLEDGFEIPYPINKLVPEIPQPPAGKSATLPQPEKKEPEPVAFFEPDSKGLQSEGVFLVYIPRDKTYLTGGNFHVMLFNMTPFHIQFALSAKTLGKYITEHAGQLGPHESIRIRQIGPGDLERWSTLMVDIHFFSYQSFEPRAPITRLLKQKPAKFYKDSSFSTQGLTSDPAIVVDLSRIMQKGQGQEEEYFDEKDLQRIMQEKERKAEKIISRQSSKNNNALEWEVDLHMEELVDNIRGMNNAQILDIQLRHFQKKLDEARAANIRKIVFIHGVGNGRLKQEIRQLLSVQKDLRFYDASYSKYGFGATEVRFN